MSKDGRAKGPVENEVEALRAMLEQRRERESSGSASDERTRDESSGEEPGNSEDEVGSGTNAEPDTEESE